MRVPAGRCRNRLCGRLLPRFSPSARRQCVAGCPGVRRTLRLGRPLRTWRRCRGRPRWVRALFGDSGPDHGFAKPVNGLPWSALKSSGVPWRRVDGCLRVEERRPGRVGLSVVAGVFGWHPPGCYSQPEMVLDPLRSRRLLGPVIRSLSGTTLGGPRTSAGDG